MNREEAIKSTHAYLTGQLTDLEKADFIAWRDASSENTQLFKEIRYAWDAAQNEMQFPEFDADAAFDQLPIPRQQQAPRTRRSVPALRIAAAVLLVAVVSWMVYQYMFKIDMVTITADAQPSVVLSDQTTVHLHAGAILTYPARFRGKERMVNLTGAGFFEVSPDAQRPFRVDAYYADAIVVGTEFGMVVDTMAGTTSLIVKEGLVRLHPHYSDAGQYVEAGAGQGAVFNNKTSVLEKLRSPDMNAVAWHTRELSFLNTPMPEVIETLETVYDVEIDYAKSGIKSCQFTSPIPFEGASVDEILGSLAVVFQLKVSSPSEGHYVLIGGTCSR